MFEPFTHAPGAGSDVAAIYVQSWRGQGLQRQGLRKAAGATLRVRGKESLGVREHCCVSQKFDIVLIVLEATDTTVLSRHIRHAEYVPW